MKVTEKYIFLLSSIEFIFFFLNLFPEYLFEKSLLQRLCFTNLVKVNFLL